MRTRWFGFRSEKALEQGCPLFTYRDKFGRLYEMTGVTYNSSGNGYNWPDKQFVVETTHMRGIKSSYVPNPDLYRS